MFTDITSAAYLLTQFIPFMVLLWDWATSICAMVLSAVVFPVYVYVMTIAWCIYQLINREG